MKKKIIEYVGFDSLIYPSLLTISSFMVIFLNRICKFPVKIFESKDALRSPRHYPTLQLRAFHLKLTAGRTPVSRIVRQAAWSKNYASLKDFLKDFDY